MLQVYLWNTNKKNNSTKRLAINEYVKTTQVILKDSTNLLNPVLSFDAKTNPNCWGYNYIYIETFDRYYYIVNWEYDRGLWNAYCDIDVLATYKTAIGATSTLIERCSNPYYINDRIYDNQVILSQSVASRINKISSQITWARSPWEGGYYIVGVNNGESLRGACQYYALTPVAFYQVINWLIRQNPYSWETSLNNKANPLQYISSIYWTPLSDWFASNSYQRTTEVLLFSTNTNPSDGRNRVSIQLEELWGACYLLWDSTDTIYKGEVAFIEYSLTWPTQYDEKEWIKVSSWKYILTAPYAGSFEVPSEICGKRAFETEPKYLRYKIDLSTGNAIMVLSSTSMGNTLENYDLKFFDNVIIQKSCRVGSDVPYGERQSNLTDYLANNILGLVGATSNLAVVPTTKAVGESGPLPVKNTVNYNENASIPTAMGVLNGITNFQSTTLERGSTGTFLESIDYILITVYAPEQIGEYDWNNVGGPCGRVLKIEDVATDGSKFVKCANAYITVNATAEERNRIITAMLGGIYYE